MLLESKVTGESHNTNPQDPESHRTVSDKPSPDPTIDDGVRQAIDDRDSSIETRTLISNEQRSDPIGLEPETDILCFEATPRTA